MRIDTKLLPPRAMIDTGVFRRGILCEHQDEPEGPVCKAFCDAMIDNKRKIFIAAPSLAEIIRRHGRPVPRFEGVEVVPFDEMAAEYLGMTLTMGKLHESKSQSGRTLTYLKFDSMIMACAVRAKVPTFVTLDSDYNPLAHATNVEVKHPSDFRDVQLDLSDLLEAAETSVPDIDPCGHMRRAAWIWLSGAVSVPTEDTRTAKVRLAEQPDTVRA